jgi:uncharacterized membrane protein YraQ (UPF0718 family)
MNLLLLSLAALFVGPALTPLLQKRRSTLIALDAFVVVAIGGLVLLHIIPDSVHEAGYQALLATGLGLMAPMVLHGPLDSCKQGRSAQLLAMAVGALALHAFLDGVALQPRTEALSSLGLAVVLHRTLEGLGVWYLVRARCSVGKSVLVLLGLAYTTSLGYLLATYALSSGFTTGVMLLQAFVAGSLLHVLLRHGPSITPSSRPAPWHMASVCGGAAAVAMLRLVDDDADPLAAAAWHFAALLAQSCAGAVLLALLCIAATHALPLWRRLARFLRVPSALQALRRLLQLPPALQILRSNLWQACRGAGVGVLTDACSCGIVPVYRSTQRRRASPFYALAFLAAAPALGFAGLLCSMTLFGWQFALCRLLAVFVLATVAARLAAARQQPEVPAPAADAPQTSASATPWQQVQDALQFTAGEVLDHMAPWSLLGLVVAVNVVCVAQPAWFIWLQEHHVEVFVLGLTAAPFYISALCATVIAAALVAKGASLGAALAFVLIGPAVSLGTHHFLHHAQGRAVAWRFGVVLLCGAYAAGYALNAAGAHSMGLQALRPAPVKFLCLLAVGGLFVISLLRQGVRDFFGQVAVPKMASPHSHHHAHATSADPHTP